jgi:hypothetical protein
MILATLIVFRLIAACLFGAGAIYLAANGKDGWGWCIFAAITLGCIDVKGD